MASTSHLETPNSANQRAFFRPILRAKFLKRKTFHTKAESSAIIAEWHTPPKNGSHCYLQDKLMKHRPIHSQPTPQTSSSSFVYLCLTFRRKMTTKQVHSLRNLKSPWCATQRLWAYFLPSAFSSSSSTLISGFQDEDISPARASATKKSGFFSQGSHSS